MNKKTGKQDAEIKQKRCRRNIKAKTQNFIL